MAQAKTIEQDLTTAMKRLEEYVLPLENKHMQDLYGVGSQISKVLIFRAESTFSQRKIHLILVKEELGF